MQQTAERPWKPTVSLTTHHLSSVQLLPAIVLFLLPLLTTSSPPPLPTTCSDILQLDGSHPSGVYTIYPIGATSAVRVRPSLT